MPLGRLQRCTLVTLSAGALAYLAVHSVRRCLAEAKKKKKKQQQQQQQQQPTSRSIFCYTDAMEHQACRPHIWYRLPCRGSGAGGAGGAGGGGDCAFRLLERLVACLDGAQRSIDACLYLLTLDSLAEALVKAQRRGVRVRVLLDYEMSASSKSKLAYLRENGTDVRCIHSIHRMHHKFCIMDSQQLVTGSLNWTLHALSGNWDDVLITQRRPLVSSFQLGFNEMWLSTPT